LNGKLFSNRLSFFRQYDEEKAANRGDRHEAIIGWHQPDQIKLTINDKEIEGIAAPISVSSSAHDDLNLFCLYGAHSGNFTKLSAENALEFKEQLKIPADCLNLGEYAVVVLHAGQFVKRVQNKVEELGIGLNAGLVDYYEPSEFSGTFTAQDAAFKKRNEFEHQREYRFVFDTGQRGSDPLELEIGDISDLATLCSTSEVNNLLKVHLPDGTVA
jgi:hypothetical protein